MPKEARGVSSPAAAGVTGSSGLPVRDAGNYTGGFWESSTCSQVLTQLSSTKAAF